MWDVETTDTFDAWFELQSRALKEDMLATMLILSEFGPQLGLPYVDTVKDSTFQNMKETPGSASWAPHPRLFCF